MILGGDLGGTKTLLALAEHAEGKTRIVLQRRYASSDHPDFDKLLGDFLREAPPVESACFGLAGPTDGQTGKLTYQPWTLSAAAIGRRFAIKRVCLINDFAAAAHGLPLVDANAVTSLQAGIADDNAPQLIIGPGTGLGVAGIIGDATGRHIVTGEGGHIGFSPQTPEQFRLAQWLHDRRDGRVTVEDIVSGPGLARIHAFLGGDDLPPEAIAHAAITGKEARAVAAIELWLACFGAFVGDMGLAWLAYGGIHLAGGIAARVMPHVNIAPFLNACRDKREHANLARELPIALVHDEALGLKGALSLAAPKNKT